MNGRIEVIGGVDPGINGSLAMLIAGLPVIYDIPKLDISGKKKKDYDLPKMSNILKPFQGQDVLFAIEKVSARPGEGVVSSFNFGRGFGYWQALATAFGFKVVEITPRKWKEAYVELTSAPAMEEMKMDSKTLRKEIKNTKDISRKKLLKKDIDVLSRKIKALAKDNARALAMEYFPSVSDCFKLKKHADRAEACLIARYVKEHQNELV